MHLSLWKRSNLKIKYGMVITVVQECLITWKYENKPKLHIYPDAVEKEIARVSDKLNIRFYGIGKQLQGLP